ncbi:MAG: CheR family methyltransferase [Spirochaeta sp.]
MPDFLSDTDFERFRNLIYDESGIHFSSTNRSILESRLKERLKRSGLDTIDAYFRVIKSNEDEMKILLDSVTTNLTRFFRNTAHFQTFEHFVIPDLIQHKRTLGDKKLRIWSAGCSTGEEPYTIAMILLEILPKDFTFEVVSSDISLKSVMIGKEGFYSDNRMNGVPPGYLSKYFSRMEGGYQIKNEVKSLVRFDYHNLKNDSGLRNLDIIFCRNVLIYFDEAAQKAVVNRFWDALASYAYLYIGHSESLFGMGTRFEFVKTDWACVYRKKA